MFFRTESPADFNDQEYDIENKCTGQKPQSRILPTGESLENRQGFLEKSIQRVMIYSGRRTAGVFFCFCRCRLAVSGLLALSLLQVIGLSCCQNFLGSLLTGTAQKGISIIEVQIQYVIFNLRLAGNILRGIYGNICRRVLYCSVQQALVFQIRSQGI